MAERRKAERRVSAGQNMDVTRLEHENLCGQIDEILKMLRRLEGELLTQSGRIASLEHLLARDRRHAS